MGRYDWGADVLDLLENLTVYEEVEVGGRTFRPHAHAVLHGSSQLQGRTDLSQGQPDCH